MRYKTKCAECDGKGWHEHEVDEKEICPNCGMIGVFKRDPGLWTLIFGVFTLGLSLFLLPFYKRRCPRCRHAVQEKRV